MIHRLSAATIARRADCTIGCVLYEAKQAGTVRFWCCDGPFDYDELRRHRENDCGGLAAWIELEAKSDTLSLLADSLGMTLEELCTS